MMNDKPKFYKTAESINLVSLIIALLAGICISVVLSYFYNLFSTFIPFIYFNVLITIGLGMSLGIVARIISRFCKLNNKKSRLILAIVMAFSTFIFQWIAYLSCFTNGGMIGFVEYLNSIPAALFAGEHLGQVTDLYTFGSWSISSFVFAGISLGMVWLVEFGIIMVLPFLSVLKITEFPFSERDNYWYPKFTLSDQFESMSSKKYFLQDYRKDILNGIRNLRQGEGWRHGKVHIYFSESETKQYLSFEKIFVEGRGKGKRTSSYLIENLEISTPEARSILSSFHNEKEKFVVF